MPARRGGSADSHTAPRGRTDFFRLDYSGYQGYVLLDLTELSSYLPLVSSFEFGHVSGKLFPCTEGRVRTRMTSAGTPRAGAFLGLSCPQPDPDHLARWVCFLAPRPWM